jgi:hypothetical protein
MCPSLLPADRAQSPVYEPGVEGCTGHETEEVVDGSEEDEFERDHR